MTAVIRFLLNDRPTEITVEPDRLLLWVLRSDLGLTGTKYGCGQAHCGACTVLVDDQVVNTCLYPVSAVQGKRVVTIEGLAQDGRLHPVQEAFVEHDALQCGYCTPGMILGAIGLLNRNPDPTPDEIIQGMEGHLCRCGTHGRVIDAIRTAAGSMAARSTPSTSSSTSSSTSPPGSPPAVHAPSNGGNPARGGAS